MRRGSILFVLTAALLAFEATPVHAQSASTSQGTPPTATGHGQPIDGVAARIEEDILTESELRELRAFQQLVDGHAKTRSELIRELADQWIVRGEANTAKFPRPSPADVDRAYSELLKQFKSPEEFQTRCTAAGVTEAGVRRMLEEQLYLSRFIDFRFRPAAQISDEDVEKYYNQEFSPQLKARGELAPALDDVSDTIREVLIQRAISERATKWLDATREHLKIDVVTQGDRS
jgi:hypothetical protein